jgi:hypothetical protein
MTINEKDIIDLTADLSDLETATSSLSSAKKRSRRESHSRPGPNGNMKRRKGHGLVGEPFARTGREKHYRAIHYRGLLIEVRQSIVSITERLTLGRFDGHNRLRVSGCKTDRLTTRRALVRRIVEKRRSSDNEKVILCHVHWLHDSACGVPNELFLKHRDCQNIRLDIIKSVKPINIGTQGALHGRPLLR